MTDSNLGVRLRRQREGRGVSLHEIARETKINPNLLADLERGDLSQWPPGLYGRAFIRSYAEAIGLEPRDVLAEFLRLVPSDEGLPRSAPDPDDEPALPGWTFSGHPQPRPLAPDGAALRLTLALPEADPRQRVPARWRALAATATDGAMLVFGAGIGLLTTGPGGWLSGLAATAVVLVVLASAVLGTTPGRRLFTPSTPLHGKWRPGHQRGRRRA